MDFTYRAYDYMLDLIKEKGYIFCNYMNYGQFNKPVILRHDIDFSLEKAIKFARLEYNKFIKSTYFVLLSTDFYNVFSKKSYEILREIKDMGHDIGLHFDEKRYEISDPKDLEFWVNKEKFHLEELLNCTISVVSMHRPSRWILGSDIRFKEVINTYSKIFIGEFKYLSDSRMFWREDVINIVEKELYDKLHILTHPFWYCENSEAINKKLMEFIMKAKTERYYQMKENIRDINELINEIDIYNG